MGNGEGRIVETASLSTLQSTDWNEEWKTLKAARNRKDNAAFWDARAKSHFSMDPTPYSREFMRLAQVEPGERVMDMGCGTGVLAVEYAKTGCPVVAADFSEGMLSQTRTNVARAGVQESVEVRKLNWMQDWKAAGIARDSVDVAIASRSVATDDLKDALDKLSYVARRRCCITLATSFSPRADPRVMRECGIPNRHGRDFQYALNILVNEGLFPTCEYIASERKDTYDSIDDARLSMDHMVTAGLGRAEDGALAKARFRLARWLEGNLVENEEAGLPDEHGNPQGRLRLRKNRLFVWAFIAWDPRLAR